MPCNRSPRFRPHFRGDATSSLQIFKSALNLPFRCWSRWDPRNTFVMVLPTPLLLEVRWAFKNCARLRSTHVRPVRGFQSGPSFFKKTGPQSDPRTKQKDGLGATRVASSGPARSHTVGETPPTTSNGTPQQSKDLIPTARDATSVGGRRSSDVPIKVIPKAQVSPQLTLSPVERLQIEYITRQPPKHLGPKKSEQEILERALESY